MDREKFKSTIESIMNLYDSYEVKTEEFKKDMKEVVQLLTKIWGKYV